MFPCQGTCICNVLSRMKQKQKVNSNQPLLSPSVANPLTVHCAMVGADDAFPAKIRQAIPGTRKCAVDVVGRYASLPQIYHSSYKIHDMSWP